MKSRIIQTRFWDDEFVCNARPMTRYIFVYLLTCQYINICGTFQLADKKIIFETGIDSKLLPQIKKELQDNKKVFFYKGWIHVCNARRNNQYEKSNLNQIACSSELDKIPQEVKDSINLYLNSSIDTTMQGSIDTTQKPEIINNNINNINNNIQVQEKKYSKITDITEEDMDELSRDLNIKIERVRYIKDSMNDWCRAKGKGYANYKAALRNWVKHDLEKQGVIYARPKIAVMPDQPSS